jgi:hypothetical protein
MQSEIPSAKPTSSEFYFDSMHASIFYFNADRQNTSNLTVFLYTVLFDELTLFFLYTVLLDELTQFFCTQFLFDELELFFFCSQFLPVTKTKEILSAY